MVRHKVIRYVRGNCVPVIKGVTLCDKKPKVTYRPVRKRIVSVQKSQIAINFSWKMARQIGVVGFDLYAGKHHLNQRQIPARQTNSYRTRVNWTKSGPFKLVATLANGLKISKVIHA
jgi:hypothetical protein